MISIESGKFTIPEEERFIGFSGDNTVTEKQMVVYHRSAIIAAYTLCLRFDDGSLKCIPLEASGTGIDIMLIWRVRREDLLSSGVVTAQIRMTDRDGGVSHTTKDYFWVGSSVDHDDDEEETEYVTHDQLESRVSEALETVRAEIGDIETALAAV